MAYPLDSVAQFIAVDLNLGALGTVVFKHNMPDDASGKYDTCITVYDMPGAPPTLTQQDDTDYPSFQVASRALDADIALTNEVAIFQALHGVTETTIHSIHFKLISAIQSAPTPLGRDARQRFVFVRNYRATVRGVTR